ncbi:MAG: hypothetical protein ACR652_22445 [Methylocystis sp.]|uniref:hypothetical protein n=1 Tax=Methylocystis sp. TaxID=1911079 RepID=UPI003DA277BB
MSFKPADISINRYGFEVVLAAIKNFRLARRLVTCSNAPFETHLRFNTSSLPQTNDLGAKAVRRIHHFVEKLATQIRWK